MVSLRGVRLRRVFLITILALVLPAVTASPLLGQRGGPKPPTEIQVTTTVHGGISTNDYRFRSDEHVGGPFKATYNTVNNVVSHVWLSGGSWQLLLQNQSVRTVWISLSQPVGNSPPAPAPDGLYYENVEVYLRCFDGNNQETGILVIQPGQANNRCTFGVNFEHNRTKYKFVMGANLTFAGATQGTTGWATVSCTTVSGTCNSWTVTPYLGSDPGNVPTVAALYKGAKSGGWSYVGSYYNTYRIDITYP